MKCDKAMSYFKNKEIDNYYASGTIIDFLNYAEADLHNIGRYNGSLALYYKCLYIKKEDSLIYKYGEFCSGDMQRLKQFMRKCSRAINIWQRIQNISIKK